MAKLISFLKIFILLEIILISISCKKNSSQTQIQAQIQTQSSTALENEEFLCPEKGEQGDPCWIFPTCKDFCAGLFFKKEEIQICHNWPISVIEDFQTLVQTMKEGLFQDINPEVFKCFLQDTRHNFLFKSFNESDAKEFLEEIANNSSLASSLGSKDRKEFDILNTLFRKINSQLNRVLEEELPKSHDNIFLVLSNSENQSAWNWLDDFLSYKCTRDTRCSGNLKYYCKAFRKTSARKLTDFFESTYFEREYKRIIERKVCGSNSCQYGKFNDFKELCQNL